MMDDIAVAPQRRRYNILCLGETGSGKTTTLASLKSYIDLPTWKTAYCTHGFQFPTKMRFSLPRGRQLDPFIINAGDDDNEDHSSPGQSYTQKPKTYKIQYENVFYNFIDVPGSADTRGIAKDNENNQRIIEFIRDYDRLHMILIFMKSCDRRLTVQTTYCLNEALAKLHKDNIDQIGFVITHSRGSEYQAGDALECIKAFLENLQHKKGIVIKADRNNVYPVEHDAFRAFVGLQQRPDLLEEMNFEIFGESWQESRATVMKLLQDIPNHVPREMIKTLSVNEARTAVFCLMEPLAAITNIIEANRRLLEEDEDAVIEMIVNEGVYKEYVAEEENTMPMTVCTSESCQQRVPLREGSVEYTVKYRECHKPCYQPGIPLTVKGHEDLTKCEIFIVSTQHYDPDNEKCSVCSCNYKCHLHENMNIRRAERDRFFERLDRPAAQEHVQVQLQDLIEEQEQILVAVAQFGRFLNENAIISMNDAFKEMMKILIAKEENARNHDQVKRLQDTLRNYEDKYKMMNTAEIEGENVRQVLACEQIHEIINELFSLRINGRMIRDLYEAAVEGHDKNNKQ